MKARKGIATKTLFELGMFVLAFIVIAAFATPTIQVSAENILRWLSGKGGDAGEVIPNELEDAIKCSYLRCKEGCYEASRAYYENFNCSKYCEADWTDNGTVYGKICGDRAKIYPVKVDQVNEPTTISKSALEFANCLMSENDYTHAEGGDLVLVLVDKDDVRDETGGTLCRGLHAYGTSYAKLVVKATPNYYYIWSWKAGGVLGKVDTSVTTSPWEEIEIGPDELTEIEIQLAGTQSYSDIYKIVVKSGGDAIDEAFLKVEGLDTDNTRRCGNLKDNPTVTFTCEETEYFNEQICVDETLRCGKFSLTFEKYTGGLLRNKALFDIIYTDTPPTEPPEEEPIPPIKTCCSYWGSWYCVTSSDCASIGGSDWVVSCNTASECEGL